LKKRLVGQLMEAASRAQKTGRLPAVSLPDTYLEHPQKPEHGDYASGLPLKLARATGIKPMEIAQILVGLMPEQAEVSAITAAPPGFVNFKLSNRWLTGMVSTVLSQGESYGNISLGSGVRVQIEFVSANPTGPLHVGNGRGSVLGSALASVMTAAGYAVEKEYYINDAGSQAEAFYRSLYARYQQCLGRDAQIPENGYHGQYMIDLAKKIVGDKGEGYLLRKRLRNWANLGCRR
jgi:arginyl-tRNA synthetase